MKITMQYRGEIVKLHEQIVVAEFIHNDRLVIKKGRILKVQVSSKTNPQAVRRLRIIKMKVHRIRRLRRRRQYYSLADTQNNEVNEETNSAKQEETTLNTIEVETK
jgi:hypothetical protein